MPSSQLVLSGGRSPLPQNQQMLSVRVTTDEEESCSTGSVTGSPSLSLAVRALSVYQASLVSLKEAALVHLV